MVRLCSPLVLSEVEGLNPKQIQNHKFKILNNSVLSLKYFGLEFIIKRYR